MIFLSVFCLAAFSCVFLAVFFFSATATSFGVLLPVTLLSHYLDRSHQSIGGVPPIGLNRALCGGCVPCAYCFDDGIVLGTSGWNRIEQERDVHPDVTFRLRFHCLMERS